MVLTVMIMAMTPPGTVQIEDKNSEPNEAQASIVMTRQIIDTRHTQTQLKGNRCVLQRLY